MQRSLRVVFLQISEPRTVGPTIQIAENPWRNVTPKLETHPRQPQPHRHAFSEEPSLFDNFEQADG